MRTLLTKPFRRYKVNRNKSGPTSLYLFNESGDTVKDEIGGYDFTLSSSPSGSWLMGPEGLEYYHGANGDYWTAEPDLSLGIYPWSVVCRTRLPSDIQQTLWSVGSGSYFWTLQTQISGAIWFYWSTSSGTGDIRQTGVTTQDLNYHTFVAIAYSNTERAIYLDGVLLNREIGSNSGSFTPTRTRVGARARDSGGILSRGYTSLCAVYSNRALTDEEVTRIG